MTTSKRIISALLALSLLLLTACSAPADEMPETPPSAPSESEPQLETITLRVVDVDAENVALLAGETGGVYRNKLPEETAPYRAGTLLDIEFGGEVLESYPAQLCDIQSVIEVRDKFDDRCALYLNVLGDIWAEDTGLQGDTTYVGVDLSKTSLTASEQAAVAWRIGELTGLEPLTGTFRSLCDEGYIDEENLYWEDGCLLSIEETETSEKRIKFEAEKWRSGLGAIFYMDCTAKRDKAGSWSDYELGGFAIS